MKKRIFSILFALCMTATLLPTAAMAASTATAFTDVPSSHWAYDAINEMVDGGITNGYKDGTFRPDKLVNNAQFVTMVLRCFRGMLIRGEFGDDVTSAELLNYARQNCISQDTTFYRNDSLANANMTRYDMAGVVYRMFRSEQVSITSLSDTSKVADWAVIPEKYKKPVSTCYSMGVLSGIDEAGNFNGEGFMTRAQAAAVLSRMMKAAPDHVDTLCAAQEKAALNGVLVYPERKAVKAEFTSDRTMPVQYRNSSRTGEVECTLQTEGYPYLRIKFTEGEGSDVGVYDAAWNFIDQIRPSMYNDYGGVVCIEGKDKINLVFYNPSRVQLITDMFLEKASVIPANTPIPAGALQITTANATITGKGTFADGVFAFDDGAMEGVAGFLNFKNYGYSKLTITVTTPELIHSVIVDVADSRVKWETQPANTTRTYTMQVPSGDIGIRVGYGFSSYATVSNIYLHN